ncbi:MAG: replicative DNA helicase [Candidatus Kapabacteria bacterium]|nr:replicative DNA helicase [Candidatus Kapabacteria bacterium]
MANLESKRRNGSQYSEKRNFNNPDLFKNLSSSVPPHSKDAEIAVLGSMIMSKSAIAKAIEIIDEDSFYFEQNRKIFNVISIMFEKGLNIDILTLSEELTHQGNLEFIGGTYYLTEIVAQTPTAANVEQYSRIVQEKYLKRSLIETSYKIISASFDDTNDALEEIDVAEREIFAIAEKRFKKSYQTLSKVSHSTMDLIDRLRKQDSTGITGVPSGYYELDELLGGFQNSDLIIIAGRPSMGKTALALSIARNIALDYGYGVGFFSIEMSGVQLVMRLLSAETKIDQHLIRTGKINNQHMSSIVEGFGKLSVAPMVIDDSPMLSIMELRAKARRMRAEHKIKAIFVDYLQLMHAPKAESREREISFISQSLKSIAKELDIPVIALAQLNRSVESRSGDKRPMLSDLRESGSIEQDADVVMFVNRPEVYGIMQYDDKTPTINTGEVIIGKQRNGPIGIARLAYIKNYARFENLDTHHTQPPMGDYDNNPNEIDDAPF